MATTTAFAHALERAIRTEIEEACVDERIVLSEHHIQDLIIQRIREIAEELAMGANWHPVPWPARVKDVHRKDQQAKIDQARRSLNVRIKENDKNPT